MWLDRELTSPYEYYQYWVNIDDRDVKRFLSFFTFLPLHEIEELTRLQGEDLRRAKDVLAYEATRICHGREAAEKARSAARELFSQNAVKDIEAIPTYAMRGDEFGRGIEAYILFQEAGLCRTRGEARRLISQGGAYVNGKRVPSIETIIGLDDIRDNIILLRAGKKSYLKVYIQDSKVE